MSERIDEKDLPRVSPAPTAHLRAVQGGKSVLVPLPQVENASALVAEAIDDVKATGLGQMSAAVAQVEQSGRDVITQMQIDASDVIHQAEVDIAAVLAGMGLTEPVEYAGDIYVESSRFTVRHDGAIYYPKVAVPFTTPETFDSAQWQLVQGLTAAELASDSGVAMVSGKLSGDSQKRQLIDILSKDIMFSISNAIPLAHTGDVRSYVQAALNEAASSGRAGRREVVFRARGEYEISNFLTVPSGVRLIFDGDSRFKPTSTFTALGTSEGLRAYGSLPAANFIPTADVPFGSYKIPAGANVGQFEVGDYVWIQSTDRIDTSPNTKNLPKAQMAKILAVDGADLVLDRLVEYDFPAATTTFGKPTIISGVRVENFVWGDPSMTIRSGRGIDFRFHDDLKILGCDIGWSRETPTMGLDTDTQNLSAINLMSCSNVLVDGLKSVRSAWYGVGIDGASHNVTVRRVEAHLVRHAVSLNWNGPGEPIHVLVDDSTCSMSNYAGFDTHDVGRDITFRKLRTTSGNTDGFQVRTSWVLLEDVTAAGCPGVGVRVWGEDIGSHGALFDIKARGVRVRGCGGGVYSVSAIDISGFSIFDCVNYGLSINGGYVQSGRIANSNIAVIYRNDNMADDAQKPLTLRDIDAPASPSQTMFLRSTRTFEGKDLRMRDVRAIGYSPENLVTRTGGSTYIGDIDHNGCAFGSDPREGTVVLSSGTAVIANNNIVVPGSATQSRVFRSAVEVQRLVAGGTVGSYTVTLTTGQIVITSSSNTDTSTVSWRII